MTAVVFEALSRSCFFSRRLRESWTAFMHYICLKKLEKSKDEQFSIFKNVFALVQ